MPVLVRWEWQERKKSFCVIFQFYDDFSEKNIRMKDRNFFRNKAIPVFHYSFPGSIPIPDNIEDKWKGVLFLGKKSVMTWAPSIPEMGYLLEVLKYAFIVNGMNDSAKRKLRILLESTHEYKKGFSSFEGAAVSVAGFLTWVNEKKIIVDAETKKNKVGFSCCFELCPEYIDYLKNVLKPYIS